jgi:hypothetical protein
MSKASFSIAGTPKASIGVQVGNMIKKSLFQLVSFEGGSEEKPAVFAWSPQQRAVYGLLE